MLYCKKCKKEVIIYAISAGVPGAEEAVEGIRKQMKKEGKLIIFNPPPRGPYTCPNFCGTKLVEKKEKK